MGRLFGRVPARLAAVLVAASVCLATLPALPAFAADSPSAEGDVVEVSAEEQLKILSESRVGVTDGTLDAILLLDTLPEGQVHVYSADADSIAAVAAGRADYASVGEIYATLFQRQNPGYVRYSPAFMPYDCAFGVAEGNDGLKEKVNEVLARMRDSGELDALYQKWVVDGDYSMEGIPKVESGPVLRVAGTIDFEPMSFIMNGERTGFEFELIERVAYELGMQVEFQDLTFGGLIAAVASGKADIAFGLTPTDERDEQVDFSDAYIHTGSCLLAKASDAEGEGFLSYLERNFRSSFIDEQRWKLVVGGLGVTMGISVGAMAVATLLGLVLCGAEQSRNWFVLLLTKVYDKLSSGIPTLVWLMLSYYVIFSGVGIPAPMVAVICLGVVAAGGVAQVFQAGLGSVSEGEVEAALALGFSEKETRMRVVYPQALASVRELYAGEVVSMIKGTSVVGYVAIADLTKVSDIIRSRTFQALFPIVSTALVYFAAIALSVFVLGLVGRLLDPKRRKPARVLRGIKAR